MDRGDGGGPTGRRRQALIVALAGLLFTTGQVSSLQPAVSPTRSGETTTGDDIPGLDPARTSRPDIALLLRDDAPQDGVMAMAEVLANPRRGFAHGGRTSCRTSPRRLCAPT